MVGSLEVRFFLLLETPLTAVGSVEMRIPFLQNRSLESSRSFRITHFNLEGESRPTDRALKLLKRWTSGNWAKICFWHEDSFPYPAADCYSPIISN